MGFFQDRLIKYLPSFYKENDTYKTPENNETGILERFLRVLGEYLDTDVIPQIDNFVANTIDPKEIYLPFVPYLEEGLGVDLFYSKDVEKRKQVLKYFIRISQIKGSKRGYEVCFRLAGFLDITVLTFDIEVFFGNPLPSAGCDACYEYDIVITTTRDFFEIEDVQAFYAVSEYNEPINAKLRNIRHNDNLLTTDYVRFYFESLETSRLLCELYQNTTFEAYIDETTGELLIQDANADFYQFDDEYFFNEGYVLVVIPSQDAYAPFESLVPNNITKTSFRARWSAAPDAVSYILNVGTDLGKAGTIANIVKNKVVDSLNVGSVTNTFVTDLQENTVYYYQVLALRADGNIAYSKPQSVITKRTVPAPTNLQVSFQGNYFAILEWDNVALATAWRYDIATDVGFTTLIQDNVLIQGRANKLRIELPNQINYYIRLRAVYNRAYGFFEDFAETIESASTNSNILNIDMALAFVEHEESEFEMSEFM